MKKIWVVAGVLLMGVVGSHHALALSEDKRGAVNDDGSVKYADPDDQKPGFVTAPEGASAGNGGLSVGSSSVTMPVTGDNDGGARAFDRAFSHQQDKE